MLKRSMLVKGQANTLQRRRGRKEKRKVDSEEIIIIGFILTYPISLAATAKSLIIYRTDRRENLSYRILRTIVQAPHPHNLYTSLYKSMSLPPIYISYFVYTTINNFVVIESS